MSDIEQPPAKRARADVNESNDVRGIVSGLMSEMIEVVRSWVASFAKNRRDEDSIILVNDNV